jgi:hypothetical protein
VRVIGFDGSVGSGKNYYVNHRVLLDENIKKKKLVKRSLLYWNVFFVDQFKLWQG